MIIKFADKKSYDVCHTFLNGNGFCFRPRQDERIFEFAYEYSLNEVVSMCNNTIGLKGTFEIL